MARPRVHRIKNCIVCSIEFEPRKPNGVSYPSMVVCSIRCRSVQAGRAGKGRPTPVAVREKIRLSQLGEKGNNWSGGVWKSQPQSERKSSRYRALRKEVLKRDNYKCVLCGGGGELEVDHIKSYSKYPDLRFDKANLRTLCKPCHKLTPTYCRG